MCVLVCFHVKVCAYENMCAHVYMCTGIYKSVSVHESELVFEGASLRECGSVRPHGHVLCVSTCTYACAFVHVCETVRVHMYVCGCACMHVSVYIPPNASRLQG